MIPLASKLFPPTVSILTWLIPISALAQAPTIIEIKPSGLHLNQPPVEEFRRSFVLRYTDGPMNVLSVAPSDPAIRVDLKEKTPGTVFLVTTILPTGYKTPSRESAEIVITTDVKEQPSVRIPITVYRGKPPLRDSWLAKPETLIGKPAPSATVGSPTGQKVRIGPVSGKITVIMFWATWCEHCTKQLPMFQSISESYEGKDVAFLTVCTGPEANELARSKGLRWSLPTGLDTEYKLRKQYQIEAYPMVYVIGRTGVLEAVHGRERLVLDGPDGLENLETELRTELDILLADKTRADFPSNKPTTSPASSTQPAAQSPTTRPATPVLVIDPSELNVGEQKPGAPIVHKILYRNNGSKDLKLTAINGLEGIAISPDYPKLLPPSGLGIVRCKFTAPQEPGHFKRLISIDSNDSEHPLIQIALSGSVEG